MENLISQFKKEHTILLGILEKIKIQKIGSPEWRNEIMNMKNTLLSHLNHEDNNLYPVLSKASLNNSQLKTTLDIFAKDMENISKEALELFELIDKKTWSKELIKAFAQFYARIKVRIRREENILYPELEKLGAKSS